MKKIGIILLVILLGISCDNNELSLSTRSNLFELGKTLHKNTRAIQHIIDHKNTDLEEITFTKKHFRPLVGKTRALHEISNKFNSFIDSIQNDLFKITGADTISSENSLQQFIIQKQTANNLKNIHSYLAKKNIPSQVQNLNNQYFNEIESYLNLKIKETIFEDTNLKMKYKKILQDEIDISPSVDFTTTTFISVLTSLYKLKNDNKNIELELVNFLTNQAAIALSGCNFGLYRNVIVANVPKSYIRLGETYHVDISPASTSPELFETMDSSYVDNKKLKLGYWGAEYVVHPKSIGNKKFTAKIYMHNSLTGEAYSIEREFNYYVSARN